MKLDEPAKLKRRRLTWSHMTAAQIGNLLRDLELIQQGKLRGVLNPETGKHEWREWNRPKSERGRCGARRRNGRPCRCEPMPGKRRCRLHGGASTGPKTEAGREAIRESNRRRARAARGLE